MPAERLIFRNGTWHVLRDWRVAFYHPSFTTIYSDDPKWARAVLDPRQPHRELLLRNASLASTPLPDSRPPTYSLPSSTPARSPERQLAPRGSRPPSPRGR